jgi:hypothetical protein
MNQIQTSTVAKPTNLMWFDEAADWKVMMTLDDVGMRAVRDEESDRGESKRR